MLELDHVFFLVSDPEAAARRLEEAGWVLDPGQVHRGQGTRNRRLVWPQQFFELLWVTDAAECRANALRLDRRAEWAVTGASPIGLAFRGEVGPEDGYWLYDALGPRIWIHSDNERFPERPLVFVLEADDDRMGEIRAARGELAAAFRHRRGGVLREVRVGGPAAPALPPFAGPRVSHAPGPHRLELVVGEGPLLEVGDGLAIRG